MNCWVWAQRSRLSNCIFWDEACVCYWDCGASNFLFWRQREKKKRGKKGKRLGRVGLFPRCRLAQQLLGIGVKEWECFDIALMDDWAIHKSGRNNNHNSTKHRWRAGERTRVVCDPAYYGQNPHRITQSREECWMSSSRTVHLCLNGP